MTKRAFRQFERAIRYIREDQDLYYAKIVHSKIIDAVSHLEMQPLLGVREPILAHKKSDYRFIIVWSYKIIYRVDSTHVVIARIFHTSRNPKKLRGA
ncbi:MAG: type II toxin-antitoxin system RelE/ParE family toxin [Cyclobacteriaceae bacterium]|nr:type II toxin-antitoxin system RelE/ParE family toxin [Cyclobacteriaceae bacterium]